MNTKKIDMLLNKIMHEYKTIISFTMSFFKLVNQVYIFMQYLI